MCLQYCAPFGMFRLLHSQYVGQVALMVAWCEPVVALIFKTVGELAIMTPKVHLLERPTGHTPSFKSLCVYAMHSVMQPQSVWWVTVHTRQVGVEKCHSGTTCFHVEWLNQNGLNAPMGRMGASHLARLFVSLFYDRG